jgi:spore photoproduct lyase
MNGISNIAFPIRKVYVEHAVHDTTITRNVLQRLGGSVPVEFVEDGRDIIARHRRERGAQRRGKQNLLLTGFRAQPIKPCPGTPDYLCCGYQILNFGTGCPLDCAYCILQDYFSNPFLVVQANCEAFLRAAADELRAHPDRLYRLGTGEFTDSLALDPLTGYAAILVEFIRDFPNAALELKTKAAHVDPLLHLDHRGRTICAWSVNSARIVESEEYGVAPLEARLEAARRVEAAGYRLAFHFDPIFHYEGWEEGYKRTVERIFETVRADSIAWISLGCFRYTPGLERVIRERFPTNQSTFAEFILAGDGKMRYPQPVRVRVYRKMLDWIRGAGGEKALVYFCMENAAVWRNVMGYSPRSDEELAGWLDGACWH